ncbi:MAG: sensor histidine kinase, partial [Sciscionella sp.]
GAADSMPAAERERLLGLLLREARRAGVLINDLLDLARLDAGIELALGPVQLGAVAAAGLDRIALTHPGVHAEVHGPPVWLRADPDRLAQIVTNLLDNAAKAVAHHGQITVAIEPDADRVLLRVIDDGPGVPAGERSRIFERMTRLDAARDREDGGAGLGLAIARGLARAHGGELCCAEPPDGSSGAVFVLRLPLAGPREATPEGHPVPGEGLNRQ